VHGRHPPRRLAGARAILIIELGGIYLDRDIILLNYSQLNNHDGDLILVSTERVYNYKKTPLVIPGIIISKVRHNSILKNGLNYAKGKRIS